MTSTGYVMRLSSDTGAASFVHLYNALLTQHSVKTSGKSSSWYRAEAYRLVTEYWILPASFSEAFALNHCGL
ncbi:hypothetical protein VNO78_08717 [Psophocarpus tetragonolobus]|uniref:Uncharacterized protein n=1 Tax=Psophocarpus tetragonolobus TaxID=3891 RepID=A0AAN9XU04_PSOTE